MKTTMMTKTKKNQLKAAKLMTKTKKQQLRATKLHRTQVINTPTTETIPTQK